MRDADIQRLQTGAHTRDRAVMVRALLVDHAHKTAPPLVQMIGHVRHEIGVSAVALAHHPVLVVAEIGGAQPQRIVLLVGMAAGDQLVDRLLHLAVGVQRGLQREHIEIHAEGAQIEVLLAAQIGHREMADRLGIVHIAGGLHVLVVRFHRFLRQISLGDIRDVIAAIARFRPGRMVRRDAHAAQLHRARQVIDLHTRIVVVKLARHIPARRMQHVAQTIAHRRAAPVPDMQRSGRVRRDELHAHLAPRAEVDMPIARARLQHAVHHVLLGRSGDEHIDEARPGDLQFLDDIGFRQRRDQRLRDVARRFAQRLGQLHRQIAGVIAMRRQLGALDQYLDLLPGIGSNLAQRLREQFGQMGFEIQDDGHATP